MWVACGCWQKGAAPAEQCRRGWRYKLEKSVRVGPPTSSSQSYIFLGLREGPQPHRWDKAQNTHLAEVGRGRASARPKTASSEVSVVPPANGRPCQEVLNLGLPAVEELFPSAA